MPKMTPAQTAFFNKSEELISRIGAPFTGEDWTDLISQLHKVEPRTIWGTLINWAIREGQDMGQLVGELSSQAVDDPFTMMAIVGPDATVLLLRYYQR